MRGATALAIIDVIEHRASIRLVCEAEAVRLAHAHVTARANHGAAGAVGPPSHEARGAAAAVGG